MTELSDRKQCVFCEIINKKIPASIVYEDNDVICFLPKKIEAYGHTLVVPKSYFKNIYDIPEEILCKLMNVCKMLSLSYRENINATGVSLLHASGRDAQQSVFHFHIHLLPRFTDDNLDTWPKLSEIDINRDELLARLKID